MTIYKSLVYWGVVVSLFVGCASQKQLDYQDDQFATEASAMDSDFNTDGDDFADFDSNSDMGTQQTQASDSSNSLDDEFADFDSQEVAVHSEVSQDEFADFDLDNTDASSQQSQALDSSSALDDEFAQFDLESGNMDQALSSNENKDALTLHDDPVPTPEIAQVDSQPAFDNEDTSSTLQAEPTVQASSDNDDSPHTAQGPISTINSVKYQSNQNGGTVVISADHPLTFRTRQNAATNQWIIEVENTKLPTNLKRTLNTKDMASSIGSVDMYQKNNSKTARFVIQMRPNSTEPLVQPEGNSLLIIGAENASYVAQASKRQEGQSAVERDSRPTSPQDVNLDLSGDEVLGRSDFRDFMARNQKFYGKKISIIMNDIDVREALSFLSDESGVNMIIDDNVSGRISIKLKSVPWDQAFALILKSKGLAYVRQGSVIRVASAERLFREEAGAVAIKNIERNNAPLKVRRFFIGYSDVTDLEKKIQSFLSDQAKVLQATAAQDSANTQQAGRGSVISDARTSSIIVTDTEENLDRVAKLIKALDAQPPQVLIEAKVVEASEKFTRNMGVNWFGEGISTAIGKNAKGGLINITPSIGYQGISTPGGLNANMTVGTLDLIGDLSARLSLNEKEDKIRVLSAPRITVLTNTQASIEQTTQIMLPTSTTSSTANATQTQTYQPYSFGVTLKVTPQVSNEGTVTMNMDIERSYLGSVGPGGAPIDKRKANSKVIVRNGQTAVIGGVFQTDVNKTNEGIPLLKDIPLLGTLFRGQNDVKSKNELIIFITPKILKNLIGDNTDSMTGQDFE